MTTFLFNEISLCNCGGGIYAIHGKHNGYNLVGQTSRSMAIRWSEHVVALNKNKHNNKYLQHSFNKHGSQQFVFIVLEEINDKQKLDEREIYWIKQLKSMKTEKGWNMREGGSHGCYGKELRDRVSIGIRSSPKALASRHIRRKPLILISPQGEKNIFAGQRLFCKIHNINAGALYRLLKGKIPNVKGWTLAESIQNTQN